MLIRIGLWFMFGMLSSLSYAETADVRADGKVSTAEVLPTTVSDAEIQLFLKIMRAASKENSATAITAIIKQSGWTEQEATAIMTKTSHAYAWYLGQKSGISANIPGVNGLTPETKQLFAKYEQEITDVSSKIAEQNHTKMEQGFAYRYNAGLELKLAERALAAYKLTDGQVEQSGVGLIEKAKIAFLTGKYREAEDYAKSMLAHVQKVKDWNSGNMILQGNCILGRLALRQGNVAEAEKYLLKAGKTFGSPQLNSFGPNMILANELLKQGRTEVVAQFIADCSKFWKNPKSEEWLKSVQNGKTPDFGANLYY